MNEGASQGEDSFVGLTSFNHITTFVASAKSSLVKSSSVKDTGVAKIEVSDGDGSEPSIHVHKQGDKITKIEFICSCGKSTHLDLEYEGE